jgi:hypothetical protein
MKNSFTKKHKALSAFFVFGVLAIVGGLTIYKSSAAPTTWTQTDWSGGPSDDVVIATANLGNLYKSASPYIDVSQSGEISVSNITSNSSFDADVNDWNYDAGLGTNLTWEDTILYSGTGSAQLDSAFDDSPALYQSITVNEAGNYILSAYVYYDGQAIDANIAQLYYDGSPIATNYDIMGGDWYRLTATIADDASGIKTYGVYKAMARPLPLYVDDIELYAETNILESNVFDMGNPQFWANLSYITNGLGNITIKARTGDSLDINGNLTDTHDFVDPACNNIISGTDMSIDGCVDDGDQYIQYQIQFTPNYNATIEYPTFEEISLQGNTSTIQFFPNNSNDTEADIVVQMTVSLNGILEEDASVDYTITGTAENGTDYTFLADGTLTIMAGDLTSTIDINGIIDDLLNEEDETIIVTLSNPINTSLGAQNVYTYTINDNDLPPNVSWFTASEMVSEDFGAPVTITAILDNPSGKEISIPFDITGTAIGGGVDYTLTPEVPSPLIIPAGDIQASFTIDFNNDDIYEDDETIIITMDEGNIINATTNGIDPTVETVTIVNDENVPTIAFTINSSENTEDITPINIEISLSAESAFDTTVDYTVTGGDATGGGVDYTLANGIVTILAGNTSTNIVLDIINDNETEAAETIEITLSNPTNADLGLNNIHTYTIFDDDVPGVNTSLISNDTTEGGISGTFTVTLNTQPNADIEVTVISVDESEGTVDQASLIFTHENWDTPQTVTVTGVDDFVVDGDQGYWIQLNTFPSDPMLDPDYVALMIMPINVTNLDDDEVAINITPTEITTYEYNSPTEYTFTVVLGSEPNGQVGLNLSSSDELEGTIDKSTLLFTSLDWNVPQTVTITSQDDILQDGDISYLIVIDVNTSILVPPFTTDTTGYAALDPTDVQVTNIDDDTPGVTVFPVSGTTTEAGATATFTVVLDSQPSDDVIIALSSDNTAEGTVSPASLTFTDANWNTPQTVTVTGVNDNIDDGNQSFQIEATISSGDLDYDGMLFVPIDVINEDDDTAGISVSGISGNTNEDGGTATFTITLSSEPLDDVVITMSSDDASEGSVNVASITITPETWSTPRGIIVTGLDDSIVDGNITYHIILDPASSLDLNYDGIDPANVTVINVDNDSIGFTVTQSGGSTNVTEGSTTDTYTIRLNTLPSADVVVTLTPNAQVSVNPSTLTFTPGNWGNNQTVTVTAVNDTVVEGNHTGTISHSVASADLDYHGFSISNITVAITDNDTAPSTGGGGGGGFWFPSHNPTETQPTPSQTQTDPQREQRLEKLRSLGVSIHGLIKIPDDGNPNTTFDNIVYYVGNDGKRHVFPNANIYKTWYDSFRYVRVYPMETLSQIPLGDNVRYKPGVKMIKFTSNNRVYAVEAGGKLRWILNEKVAWYMYGTGWQKQIVNIPDSLFPSYEFANDITHSNQYDFVAEANASQNISMELGL